MEVSQENGRQDSGEEADPPAPEGIEEPQQSVAPRNTSVLDESLILEASCGAKKLSAIYAIELQRRHPPLRKCPYMGDCSKLRLLFLQGNHLRFPTEAIEQCPNLAMIDLSENAVDKLPPVEFWKNMSNLKVLFLHQNRIKGFKYMDGVFAAPKLLHLTLFDNPIARHPHYRNYVVNSIHPLRCFDDFLVSDEELIEDMNMPSNFAAFTRSMAISLPEFQPNSTVAVHWEMFLLHTHNINKKYVRYSPVLRLQTWVRMRAQRRVYLEQIGVVRAERAERERIERERLEQELRVKQRGEMAAMMIQSAFRGLLGRRKGFEKYLWTRLSDGRKHITLYIPDRHFEELGQVLVAVNERSEKILRFGGVDAGTVAIDQLEESNVRCVRRLIPDDQFDPVTDYHIIADGVFRLYRPNTFERILSLHHMVPTGTPEELQALLKVQRTLGLPWVISDFVDRYRETVMEGIEYFDTLRDKESTPKLLRMRIPTPAYCRLFVEEIKAFNSDPENARIEFIAGLHLRQILACVTIQSMWRAYLARRNLEPTICRRLLIQRAANKLQRWWQNVIFRSRLRLLSELADLQKRETTNEWFISRDDYELVAALSQSPPEWKTHPEHTLQFDVSSEKVIIVHEDHRFRQALPEWLQLTFPMVASAVAEENALVDLVDIGTDIIFDCNRRAFWRGYGLSRFSSGFLRSHHMVQFDSADEALRRASLLLALTSRVRPDTSISLRSVDYAVRYDAATAIQTMWRGYVWRQGGRERLMHYAAMLKQQDLKDRLLHEQDRIGASYNIENLSGYEPAHINYDTEMYKGIFHLPDSGKVDMDDSEKMEQLAMRIRNARDALSRFSKEAQDNLEVMGVEARQFNMHIENQNRKRDEAQLTRLEGEYISNMIATKGFDDERRKVENYRRHVTERNTSRHAMKLMKAFNTIDNYGLVRATQGVPPVVRQVREARNTVSLLRDMRHEVRVEKVEEEEQKLDRIRNRSAQYANAVSRAKRVIENTNNERAEQQRAMRYAASNKKHHMESERRFAKAFSRQQGMMARHLFYGELQRKRQAQQDEKKEKVMKQKELDNVRRQNVRTVLHGRYVQRRRAAAQVNSYLRSKMTEKKVEIEMEIEQRKAKRIQLQEIKKLFGDIVPTTADGTKRALYPSNMVERAMMDDGTGMMRVQTAPAVTHSDEHVTYHALDENGRLVEPMSQMFARPPTSGGSGLPPAPMTGTMQSALLQRYQSVIQDSEPGAAGLVRPTSIA